MKKMVGVSNCRNKHERTILMAQAIVDRMVNKNLDAMVMCATRASADHVKKLLLDILPDHLVLSVRKDEIKTNVGIIRFTVPNRAYDDLQGMRIRLYIEPAVWDSDSSAGASAYCHNRNHQWDIREDKPK